MRRNFKAQLDRDRKRVFHNSREFAEIREIVAFLTEGGD